jgi:HD-like signal output (HDOD) protein
MERTTIISWMLFLIPAAAVGTLIWFYRSRQSAAAAEPECPAHHVELDAGAADPGPTLAPPAHTTPAIEAASSDAFKLAFGVARFDYQIRDEHARVLELIDESLDHSVHERDYFPRRPMLLPKLMQALNDPHVARETLVKLILEDPAIAGGVLQQANTAFYRVSPARVDNVDRAVWLLGTDGLKRLMATAIMQPVFRVPKGYFDSFAPHTWAHAQRAAAVAEHFVARTRDCDPFVAQLLAVMEALARIVIFRLAMDKYRSTPNILPRAEVFIRAMQTHESRVALLIANAWQMTDESKAALHLQARRESPLTMSPLGQAVYFANLTATLTAGELSCDAGSEVLVAQGLAVDQARALIDAALRSQATD